MNVSELSNLRLYDRLVEEVMTPVWQNWYVQVLPEDRAQVVEVGTIEFKRHFAEGHHVEKARSLAGIEMEKHAEALARARKGS